MSYMYQGVGGRVRHVPLGWRQSKVCTRGWEAMSGQRTLNSTDRSTNQKGLMIIMVLVSDKGDVFGWGNSEYSQLSIVAPDESQVNTSRHLPFTQVGKVTKVTAGGSLCAVVNGKYEKTAFQ